MGPLSSARTHYANKCFAWYLSPYNQFVLKTGWVTRVSKPLLLDSAQKRVRDGLGTRFLILWQSGFCCHLEESVSILAQRAKSSCSPRITAVTLGSARPKILVLFLFIFSSADSCEIRVVWGHYRLTWGCQPNLTALGKPGSPSSSLSESGTSRWLQEGVGDERTPAKEAWEVSKPLQRRHGREIRFCLQHSPA